MKKTPRQTMFNLGTYARQITGDADAIRIYTNAMQQPMPLTMRANVQSQMQLIQYYSSLIVATVLQMINA